jgi:parvulin-like peptidyl-prolyl isomerase
MFSIVPSPNPQLTAERVCQYLSTSHLLPQLLREMIIDDLLETWREGSAAIMIDRQAELQQFKQETWGNKVGSYYLTRKSQLDRVVCSMIQVTNGTIAQELYFRICAEPKIFSKLALNYSQGVEAFDGGKLAPTAISKLHPTLAERLLCLNPGEISPLFTIDNFYLFVRLEQIIPAQFDDQLRQVLLDELFEQWLQAQIASKIGSVSVQNL